jgi:serine/threonine protein kinase
MPVQTHESAEESLKKDGIVIIEHPEDDPTGSTRLLNVPPGNAVLDNIIVGTMDGRLVCLDVSSGREMWSISTGTDMIKASIAQLIPSLNGNLYLYNKGKLDKHPMSVYDIVAKSPFSMNDDLLYIGSKETQLYSIAPDTGDCHKCTASGAHACGDFNERGRLLVLRSDYLVKAVDRWTGEMRWNVSLGEYSTTSAVGLPMPKEHFSFPDSNFDDFSSSDHDYANQYQSATPIVPTHGLLSAMDGSLRLIEIATSKTVWTVVLPSPAVHMQNNIYTSSHLDFVLTDLKFVPQLLLHLDTTQLREGESRIFIAEHNSNLIAIEQLAQYDAPDNGRGLSDGQTAPQLDSKSGTIFSFPSSPETTPVALPSDQSKQEGGDAPLRGGQITTIDEEATQGFSFFLPTRKCTGPQDMSLDCLLGIHYIVMDPCCVGDNCMCDATLKLPDKPNPNLGDRPNQNLTSLHPDFDWASGDYDSLLRAIIMFDWYRQQIRSWPVWMQIFLPVPFLLLVVALIRKGTKPLPSMPITANQTENMAVGPEGNANGEVPDFSIAQHANQPHLHQNRQHLLTAQQGNHHHSQQRSVPDANGVIHVGKLQVLIPKVLGHGSSGTIVFEGSMNGRKVAVKRMLKTFYSIAERETHLLTQTDEHPNVIRYYTTEEDSDFIYLALSFAERTLANFIEDEECFSRLDAPQKRNLLHQLAHGMRHLHEINIVHRDIKPQNVLITGNGIVKISDMGLAKKLESDSLSLSTAAHGTVGWQAPELIIARVSESSEDSSSRTTTHGSSSSSGSYGTPSGASTSSSGSGATANGSSGQGGGGGGGRATPTQGPTRIKVSKRVDIFSLGCLFYYVLTKRHPFGDRLVRESNIVSNICDLSGISSEAADMIRKMLSAEPKMRPSAAQVLEYPYFWEPNKRLRFLKDASDFFEFEKPNSETVLRFEQAAERAGVIPDMNWVAQLPEELLQDLNKFRKYNGAKLRDLLRVIRNKAHHYRDLPPETQQTFGPLPEGFLDYFCLHRFPDLLTFTWNYARNNYSQDKVFSEYFPHGPGHVEPDPPFTPPALSMPSVGTSPAPVPSPSQSLAAASSNAQNTTPVQTPASTPLTPPKSPAPTPAPKSPTVSAPDQAIAANASSEETPTSIDPLAPAPVVLLAQTEALQLPPGITVESETQHQEAPTKDLSAKVPAPSNSSTATPEPPRAAPRQHSPVKPSQSHAKGGQGKGGFSWGKQQGNAKSSSNASTSNNWRQKT